MIEYKPGRTNRLADVLSRKTKLLSLKLQEITAVSQFRSTLSYRIKGECLFTFQKMAERYSSATENIMPRDMKISVEMDIETLRGCVEEINENPNLLKSLIMEHL